MDQAIVLKNIRRDIPAMKPLAARVILLQRQLIEAVQRYQELNSKPDKDEAELEELLKEIAKINQSQREELQLVREAESNYAPPPEEEQPNEEEEEQIEQQPDIVQERTPSPECPPIKEEPEEIDEIPEEPMDWEDLTREQWSETDKLLQRIERVGSRVLQQDFMSSVDLVHVDQYKAAEEALAKRKQRMTAGKKVITTGPWQVIDIPTKVTNRRCNYLTGLHVTIRQKDPARRPAYSSAPTISEGNGVKTRLNQQHDSRGSSRTSSRASSPVSSQTDNNSNSGCTNGNVLGHNKHLRSNKSRASKLKKTQPTNNNLKVNAPAKTNGTTTPSSSSALPATDKGTTTTDKAGTAASSKPLEPCITYTVVDGVPHFKVFFPSKDSNNKAGQQGQKITPHATIVESDIEMVRASPPSSSAGRENWHNPLQHQRNNSLHNKPSSIKAIKRPRLAQSLSPSKPASGSGNGSLDLASSAQPAGNKEELGRCIEKCGSWMGAPHFKIYRTIPSVNAASPSSAVDSSRPAPTSTPPTAPKLSSPKASPGVVGIKASSIPPKLTMGGLPGAGPIVAGSINNNGKFVPIAPKSSVGGRPEPIQPLAGKIHQPTGGGVKRPASLLRACPPLFNGSSQASGTATSGPASNPPPTVKNLKECLQNNVKVQPTSDGQPMNLKKAKVVTLFPTGGDHQRGSEDGGGQQNFSPPPTVIVADMSI